MTTFYLGTLLGITYFVLDLPSIGRRLLHLPDGESFVGLISDPDRGLGIPFMLVGPILTAVCAALFVTVSLLTPAMDPQQIAGTVWNRPSEFLRGRLAGWTDPRLVSAYLLVTVSALYAWLH
jgi:hypothetical protein